MPKKTDSKNVEYLNTESCGKNETKIFAHVTLYVLDVPPNMTVERRLEGRL